MSTGFYQQGAPPPAGRRAPPPPPPRRDTKKAGNAAPSFYGGGGISTMNNNPPPPPQPQPTMYDSGGGMMNNGSSGAIQPTTTDWFSDNTSNPVMMDPVAPARIPNSNSLNRGMESQPLGHNPVSAAPGLHHPTVGETTTTGAPTTAAAAPFDLSGPMTSIFSPSDHIMNSNANSTNRAQDELDFANEPPLMEELGIHVPNILQKSRAVIFPFSSIGKYQIVGTTADQLDASVALDDADLVGPLAFALLLGSELLLTAKMNFGYIYGFSLFGCLAMASLLNLMNPKQQQEPHVNAAAPTPSTTTISVWSIISILGYSLLPVNALALVNVFVRLKNHSVGAALGVLTVLWCTVASTRLFERGCGMRDQRYLVAYPTALFFSCFVIITIY